MPVSVVDEATNNVGVSHEAWTTAAALLDGGQLAELVFVIAFYNMVARILGPLEVDRDPRYEAIPSEGPTLQVVEFQPETPGRRG